MKTLHYSIIAICLIGLLFIPSYLKPIQADNAGGIEIQNIQVEPSTIKVGDTFTVTATLVNNSTVPIVLEGGTCVPLIEHVPFFTIILDNHTKIKAKNLTCAGVGLSKILNPGKNIIGTSPDSTFAYIATESGTANVTVTFSYHVTSQTDSTQPNIEQTISKSLLFTISDNNTGTKRITETVLSPLQQFKSGVDPYHVISREIPIVNIVYRMVFILSNMCGSHPFTGQLYMSFDPYRYPNIATNSPAIINIQPISELRLIDNCIDSKILVINYNLLAIPKNAIN